MSNITITLWRNQLKYDVDTETRKSALFQVNGERNDLVDEAQMGEDISDEDYFTRKCIQGVSSLKGILHKFLANQNAPNVEGNNKTKINGGSQPASWSIVLTFGTRRNVYADQLAHLCHRFVAYYILRSWALMSMPNLVAVYTEGENEMRAEILAICHRKEPPTPPQD